MATYCVVFRREFEVFIEAPSAEAVEDAGEATLNELDHGSWKTGQWEVEAVFSTMTSPNHSIKDGKIVHIDDVKPERRDDDGKGQTGCTGVGG